MATYLPSERFGPRSLGDYEFVWIIAGDVVYHHDGYEHIATPGTVILGRPGFRETYHWDGHRPSRHAFFHFAIERAPDDWPPPDRWPVTRTMPRGDVVRPLFRRVLDTWCHRWDRRLDVPPPSVCRAVETMVDAFITGEDAGGVHRRALPDAIRRAVDHAQRQLRVEPEAPISLGQLAAAAKVSESHLIRLFRQSLDTTPMRAVLLMRLEHALTLLARSNHNVKQVAHRCGFASPYHFSRSFSQVYGASPTAMRRRLDAGEALPPPHLPVDAPPLDT